MRLNTIWLLLIITLIAQKGITQDSLVLKDLRYYKIKIVDIQKHLVKGRLHQLDSLSLVINLDKKAFPVFTFSQIQTAEFRRKGAVGRGILFGVLGGAAIGAVIGMASGDDDPHQWFAMTSGQKATGLAAIGGIFGGLVCGITTAIVCKKFTIKGRKEKYADMRTRILAKVNKRIS